MLNAFLLAFVFFFSRSLDNLKGFTLRQIDARSGELFVSFRPSRLSVSTGGAPGAGHGAGGAVAWLSAGIGSGGEDDSAERERERDLNM